MTRVLLCAWGLMAVLAAGVIAQTKVTTAEEYTTLMEAVIAFASTRVCTSNVARVVGVGCCSR